MKVLTGVLPLVAVFAMSAAAAQDFPTRPIRIVTTAAGGGGDFVTRVVGEAIAGPLGQPIVVDNRTGVIPGEIVAKAPSDGYTLALVGGAFWIAPLLRKTPYDTQSDFAYVSIIVGETAVLIVPASLPAKSVKELIALAKAKPGALNYSTSSGAGGTSHLAAELFKSMTGTSIVWVAYRSVTEALASLMNGETQMMLTDVNSAAGLVKAGKLRALGVASKQPSALMPGIATISTAGVPGFEVVNWSSVVAPARTPAAVIERLNREMVRAINQPDIKARFLSAGMETAGTSSSEMAITIKAYIETWARVIKEAGIKAD